MKKKISLLIPLLLFFIFFIHQTLNCIIDYNYDEISRNFFPRDEGSLNEKKLVKYIENFCNFNNIKYKTTLINDNEKIITNSYNIEVYLKSNDINEEQLIIICPLDNLIINRKNYDNSISIHIMLELIKKCKDIPLKKDLIFLFSGSNETDDNKYNGINFFLKKSVNLNKSIVTVINILNNKNKFVFSGSSNGKPIPYKLLKQFLQIKNTNLKIQFDRSEIYKARFFLLSDNNYVSNFLKNDIPCVFFSNKEILEPESHLNEDYLNELINYFYEWLHAIDNIELPLNIDYHYQYINIFGFKLLISETLQILFILIIVFIIIFTRIFYPGFQKLHFKLFIKSLHYFLIIFILYIILTFIPLLIFIPISYITGISKSYLNFPLLYFMNILIIPFLIILIFYQFIKKIPSPKHSYLYLFGAFSFCLINLIIFSIINISLSYIYLWAIIIIIISQYTRQNFKLKFLCYLGSFIPLLLLIIDLSQIKTLDIIKNINIFLINIIFSIFVFPFILLFLRATVIIKIRFKYLYNKGIFLFIIIFIIILLSLSSIIISTATYPGKKEIDAELVTDINNNGSYLALDSKTIIGNISLFFNETSNEYNIFKNHKNIILTNKIKNIKPYEITYEKTESNYIKVNFNIKSEYLIEYLKIYLITPKDVYPIDSDIIFKKTDDLSQEFKLENNEIYQFLIPRNVGKNLSYNIELSKNIYKFIYKIEYPFIESNILTIFKPGALINYKSSFIEELTIN